MTTVPKNMYHMYQRFWFLSKSITSGSLVEPYLSGPLTTLDILKQIIHSNKTVKGQAHTSEELLLGVKHVGLPKYQQGVMQKL
jgi:hypothetical protein